MTGKNKNKHFILSKLNLLIKMYRVNNVNYPFAYIKPKNIYLYFFFYIPKDEQKYSDNVLENYI